MKRIWSAAACLLLGLALAGCSGMPGTEATLECEGMYSPYEDVEGLPEDIQGVAVTHAVRAQAYACVDAEWHPIGGLAATYIYAEPTQPNATGGVSISGASLPWPYQKTAYLPFQLPLYIQPGISVSITATFTAILDAEEMIACWMTDSSGQELAGTRGMGVQLINGGGSAEASCAAGIMG
jgi:hypothetical protein